MSGESKQSPEQRWPVPPASDSERRTLGGSGLNRTRGWTSLGLTIKTVVRTVCDHFVISETELLGLSRRQPIADARMIAYWLMRNHTPLTYERIATIFRRHHATVIHGVQRLEEFLEINDPVAETACELDFQVWRSLRNEPDSNLRPGLADSGDSVPPGNMVRLSVAGQEEVAR